MMNNFTPRAQQVLALARKEADRFNHNYVGTEHLLLGLIKLGQGVAVNVLQKMGLDLETVRMEVEKHVGSHPETKMVGNIPYTPRVKKVLALAGKERGPVCHHLAPALKHPRAQIGPARLSCRPRDAPPPVRRSVGWTRRGGNTRRPAEPRRRKGKTTTRVKRRCFMLVIR